jgi:peptidyl-prolyl cis-trans isomerase A (cyclophilin A)
MRGLPQEDVMRWSLAASAFALALAACSSEAQETPTPAPPPATGELPEDMRGLPDGLYARLQTNLGVMTLKLEHLRAPETVGNFVGLIQGTKPWTDARGERQVGRPFYDGLIFHRVIDGFMIQGGCPQGNGMGDPGYKFRDEFHRELRHDAAGVLSMANSGPNTNGSQFFITLGPTPHLDDKHSVFGRIARGEEVLRAIGGVRTGAQNRPVEPVTIQRATVHRIREVPAAGEPDPARVPAAGQEAQPQVRVKMICLQYRDCQRQKPWAASVTREDALALGERVVRLARTAGADFDDLGRRFSDLPIGPSTQQRERTDASFAPAFNLRPGQVSDAIVTPYGVMVFQAVP